MREILFRGKSINSGEWIESMTISKGTIKRKRDWVFMELPDGKNIGIIPETVGQFTGRVDKNNRKLFDKQWIKISCHIPQEYGKDLAFEAIKQVIWKNGGSICLESEEEQEWVKNGSNHYKYADSDSENIYYLRQINNFEFEIIDDPELLKQENDEQ
jgi:hypothetical protein